MNSPKPEQITILVINDDLANLDLVLSTLKQTDYQVLTATSGASALDQLNSVRPNIILLGVMLPDIDSFELCRHLKKNPTTNRIPVIFMTTLDTVDTMKGFEVGVGSMVGGWVFSQLGFNVAAGGSFDLGSFIAAVIGAMIVIAIVNIVNSRRLSSV
jgi:CheY-like chemotaxis protein